MRIDVSFIADEAVDRRGKCIVVLDILRASSTIIQAFEAGCRSVRPVAEPDEARALREQNSRLLLCGERNAVPLPGFDLGNSPAEYTEQAVKGRDLILTTSNGTRAIVNAGQADCVLIGGFLNFTALLDKALAAGRDILFQCAGTDGAFALEDTFAAAMLVEAVNNRVCNLEIGDAARWALYALKGLMSGRKTIGSLEIETVLRNSTHGKRLVAAGFSRDISLCAQKDVSHIVPFLSSGKIIS